MITSKNITTVDEYIALQPKEVQAGLKELRQIIRKNAPRAEEVISYGMPAYKYNGMLAYFAVAKEHYGFYAMPGAIKKFADKLKAYGTSKGTIRFPLDKPLPKKLIADIIKFRVKENEQKAQIKKAAKKARKK